MYGNLHEDTIPSYHAFLSFLGSLIDLRGWERYRGGLDNSMAALSGPRGMLGRSLTAVSCSCR
jgi:hypothetical protein